MSILLKDLKMPKDKDVILRIDSKGEVYIYGGYPTEIHEAIEMPDHGDLIDRDALKEPMESVCMGIMAGTDSYNAPLKTIDDAPVIIHAEWSKE